MPDGARCEETRRRQGADARSSAKPGDCGAPSLGRSFSRLPVQAPLTSRPWSRFPVHGTCALLVGGPAVVIAEARSAVPSCFAVGRHRAWGHSSPARCLGRLILLGQLWVKIKCVCDRSRLRARPIGGPGARIMYECSTFVLLEDSAGALWCSARNDASRLCRSAEGVGFEPTRTRQRPSGFQDRRHRPLGEPSWLR